MSEPAPPRRWASDAFFNYAALGLTAVVGVVINFSIAKHLGTSTLGVFAQLYAIYVIGAQLAVFGTSDSVQKHIAEQVEDREACGAIALGGLLVSAGVSAACAGMLFGSRWLIGFILDSEQVALGIAPLAPGLILFALNKVLFAALNGRARMRAFAIGQKLRALFILGALIAIIALGLPGYTVGAIFTVAELLLLPVLVLLVGPAWLRARSRAALQHWTRRHLSFGARALVNGLLLEIHLRVDVMMLSLFLSDHEVGIYAFAALFAEGLYQVPLVIRTIAYPTLVKLFAAGTDARNRRATAAGARLVRRLSLGSTAATAAGAFLIALAYPWFASYFAPDMVNDGHAVLLVLLTGMVLYAIFVPFDQIMLQSGHPGRQSVMMSAAVLVNVVLNLLLIPRFGLVGAAFATVSSFAMIGVVLTLASWRWLGYRLGVLFYGLFEDPTR